MFSFELLHFSLQQDITLHLCHKCACYIGIKQVISKKPGELPSNQFQKEVEKSYLATARKHLSD